EEGVGGFASRCQLRVRQSSEGRCPLSDQPLRSGSLLLLDSGSRSLPAHTGGRRTILPDRREVLPLRRVGRPISPPFWHDIRSKRCRATETWPESKRRRRDAVLWTIFVILLILWLLGLVSGYTIGGFIHILLVIAVVVLLIRLIQGRAVV